MGRVQSDQLTFTDYRMHHGLGGPRKGAGRKPSGRRCDPKKARQKFDRLTPVHVTLRVRDGLPSLRRKAFIKDIRKSFKVGCERGDFRLLHYSFQDDHVHLIVEASDQDALGRGMMSISSRISYAIRRVFKLVGRVMGDPYHAHLLKTPREAYRAIVYVLMNIRKHWSQKKGRPPHTVQIDMASSARWFEGFTRLLPADRTGPREIAEPRSWLLQTGWKHYGPIDPATVPGSL